MWFASLITAIGAAFLYERFEKLSGEAAIACVAVAIASLLLTLIAAPWQIHLLMLVMALLSYPLTKTKLFH